MIVAKGVLLDDAELDDVEDCDSFADILVLAEELLDGDEYWLDVVEILGVDDNDSLEDQLEVVEGVVECDAYALDVTEILAVRELLKLCEELIDSYGLLLDSILAELELL